MIINIIDILLIISALYLLYIIYQIVPHYINNNNNNNNNDNSNDDTENISIVNHKDNIVNHFEPLSSVEHGFHDHFAGKNGFENNKHLGWRYWYLKNKSNYLVKPTGNFDNIPTRNYLSSLDNTHNWFVNLENNTDITEMVIE